MVELGPVNWSDLQKPTRLAPNHNNQRVSFREHEQCTRSQRCKSGIVCELHSACKSFIVLTKSGDLLSALFWRFVISPFSFILAQKCADTQEVASPEHDETSDSLKIDAYRNIWGKCLHRLQVCSFSDMQRA